MPMLRISLLDFIGSYAYWHVGQLTYPLLLLTKITTNCETIGGFGMGGGTRGAHPSQPKFFEFDAVFSRNVGK